MPIAIDTPTCRPSRPPDPPISTDQKHHIPNGSASHLVASHPNSLKIPFPTNTAATWDPITVTHRNTSANQKLLCSYARSHFIPFSVSEAWSPPSASGVERLEGMSSISSRLGGESRSKRGNSSSCRTPSDVIVTIGQDNIATMYARTVMCLFSLGASSPTAHAGAAPRGDNTEAPPVHASGLDMPGHEDTILIGDGRSIAARAAVVRVGPRLPPRQRQTDCRDIYHVSLDTLDRRCCWWDDLRDYHTDLFPTGRYTPLPSNNAASSTYWYRARLGNVFECCIIRSHGNRNSDTSRSALRVNKSEFTS